MLERALELARGRVDRRCLPRNRPQPERDRDRRRGDREERRASAKHLAAGEERACGGVAAERDQDEHRIGRVHEGQCERRDRDRRNPRPRGPLHVEEEQGDDPESIAKWLAWVDSLEPLILTPEDEERIRQARDEQKAFELARWEERSRKLEKLFE